jgi:hypothetical protein
MVAIGALVRRSSLSYCPAINLPIVLCHDLSHRQCFHFLCDTSKPYDAHRNLDTRTLILSFTFTFANSDTLLFLYYLFSPRRRTLTTSNSRTNNRKKPIPTTPHHTTTTTTTITAKMLPLLSALSLGKKAYKFAESRKNGGSEGESQHKQKKPMSATGKLRLFLGLPVILTAIALLLSVLCVYAGSKPGMMDNYAVFTLNTSRVGENVLSDINGAIKAVDIKFKRSEEFVMMTAPAAMITPAPTTMVTMAQRDLHQIVNSEAGEFTSKAGSLTSKAGAKATSAKSVVASKASSAQGAAKSAANSAVGSAQKKVIDIVNKAFRNAVDGLELKDIYNIHISSSCIGTYEYKDGKNYTSSDPVDKIEDLRPRIDSCEKHSAVNPFQVVRIVYWIAVVMTAIALILGIFGLVRPTKKVAMINVLGTLPALIFMGLASAVTHGMATGAAHLITFVGEKVGITGVAGSKFITLTWATTIMLLVNMSFWALAVFLIGRSEKMSGGAPRQRPDRSSMVCMGEYEVSRPLPAHVDRNGHAMI